MDSTLCITCGKRRYGSISAARSAFRRAGFRFRVYFCRESHSYHVTNSEKH